jgi:hypothetical protein
MRQRAWRERRREHRYAVLFEFRGKKLSSLGFPKRPRGIVNGKVQNLSAGGLCLLTDQPIKELHLVRGELVLPNVPVGIPTLMQARWVHRATKRFRYRIGMQFVL